jgi:hypothetical protein
VAARKCAAGELFSGLQGSQAERNEEEVEDEEGKLQPPVAWYEFGRKPKSSTTELPCWLLYAAADSSSMFSCMLICTNNRTQVNDQGVSK